jgi:hypothetical protein
MIFWVGSLSVITSLSHIKFGSVGKSGDLERVQEREDAELDILEKVGEGNGSTACLIGNGIHHFLLRIWKDFLEKFKIITRK